MIKSSWAVLLCKFSDDSTEPFPRDYYEDLFTATGIGSVGPNIADSNAGLAAGQSMPMMSRKS